MSHMATYRGKGLGDTALAGKSLPCNNTGHEKREPQSGVQLKRSCHRIFYLGNGNKEIHFYEINSMSSKMKLIVTIKYKLLTHPSFLHKPLLLSKLLLNFGESPWRVRGIICKFRAHAPFLKIILDKAVHFPNGVLQNIGKFMCRFFLVIEFGKPRMLDFLPSWHFLTHTSTNTLRNSRANRSVPLCSNIPQT